MLSHYPDLQPCLYFLILNGNLITPIKSVNLTADILLQPACSKTWSGLVWSGLVWSGLIWLVSFYWSGLFWSGLYGLFIGLFKLYIINHDVTYWCCLFFNSHSNDLYQYFCITFMISFVFIFVIVSVTKY